MEQQTSNEHIPLQAMQDSSLMTGKHPCNQRSRYPSVRIEPRSDLARPVLTRGSLLAEGNAYFYINLVPYYPPSSPLSPPCGCLRPLFPSNGIFSRLPMGIFNIDWLLMVQTGVFVLLFPIITNTKLFVQRNDFKKIFKNFSNSFFGPDKKIHRPHPCSERGVRGFTIFSLGVLT